MSRAIVSIENKLPGLANKSYASCICYEDRIELKTWFDGFFPTSSNYSNKQRTIFIKDIVSVIIKEPKRSFEEYLGYIQFYLKGASETNIETQISTIYKTGSVSKAIDMGAMYLVFQDQTDQMIKAQRIKDYVEKQQQKKDTPCVAPRKCELVSEKQDSKPVLQKNSNFFEELKVVVSMYERGLLTEEEFKKAKKKLLD